jgi:hypothetical protein
VPQITEQHLSLAEDQGKHRCLTAVVLTIAASLQRTPALPLLSFQEGRAGEAWEASREILPPKQNVTHFSSDFPVSPTPLLFFLICLFFTLQNQWPQRQRTVKIKAYNHRILESTSTVTSSIIIMSRVRGSVTNNNGFWIGWWDYRQL